MGKPFHAIVHRPGHAFDNPSILVQNKHGEEVTVDLTQDEHGAVTVNVRPGKGMTNSVDVELHVRGQSKLLV